jgi:hypothetical protein
MTPQQQQAFHHHQQQQQQQMRSNQVASTSSSGMTSAGSLSPRAPRDRFNTLEQNAIVKMEAAKQVDAAAKATSRHTVAPSAEAMKMARLEAERDVAQKAGPRERFNTMERHAIDTMTAAQEASLVSRAADGAASGADQQQKRGGGLLSRLSRVRSDSSELVEALDLQQVEGSVRDPLPEMTKREWLLKAHAELVHDGDDPAQIYQVDRDKRLGKGGFGEVFLGIDQRTGEKVAIKQMQINQKNKMEHPNVVQFLDAFLLRDKLEFWVVLEYVGGGPLNEFKHLPGFKEPHIAHCVKQVLSAIVYIHRTNRIHRDIKSANVLVASDGNVKLTDFGLAAQLTTEFQQRSTVLGTADFMAPEIIERKPYGVKVDVWAIGMFVIELAHRTTPFHGMPPKTVLDNLQARGPPKLPNTKGKKWTESMRAFVATCLVMDPEKRPSSASLERNPWLKRACEPSGMLPLIQTLRDGGNSTGGCTIQ